MAEEEKTDDAGGDCGKCSYHKRLSNPAKGVKIPGSYGKCIRPGGHCNPEHPDTGF